MAFKTKLPNESQIQKAVCQYLDANNYLYFHVPNAQKFSFFDRNLAARIVEKLKCEGMKPGVPDLVICHKNAEGKGGLYIELKTKSGRISEKQKQWIKDLKTQGYQAVVCNSLDDAMIEIEKYKPLRQITVSEQHDFETWKRSENPKLPKKITCKEIRAFKSWRAVQ